jgi:transcriptional regulator with XRE-family HTH domain
MAPVGEGGGHLDPWTQRMLGLGEFIRGQRTVAHLSQRDVAERAGISNAYLSQIERGLHEPSIRVLHAIASALGVPFDLLLTHAGVLDRPATDSTAEDERGQTAAAIRKDQRLTGPQKYALLSIYRSFVGSD